VKHETVPNLDMLLAKSPLPGDAELIGEVLSGILAEAGQCYDLIIVDCSSSMTDTTLAILDQADVILTMLTLEITSIKNMRLFLEVTDQLGYESSAIKLVLNRADSTLGIRVADVEQSIGRKVDYTIVSDGRSVVYALNRGIPFFMSNREAQVSQDILRLATSLTNDERKPATEGARTAASAKKSLFAWR